jgi:hypothetical protein
MAAITSASDIPLTRFPCFIAKAYSVSGFVAINFALRFVGFRFPSSNVAQPVRIKADTTIKTITFLLVIM